MDCMSSSKGSESLALLVDAGEIAPGSQGRSTKRHSVDITTGLRVPGYD